MSWAAVAGGGLAAAGAVAGSAISSKAASKAANAAGETADAQVNLARETRDIVREDQRPYTEAGYSALDALMSLTGIQRPASVRNAAQFGMPDPETAGPYGGVSARPNDFEVQQAFQKYRGRRATKEEVNYYTNRRGRGDQLFADVIGNSVLYAQEQEARQAPAGEPGTATNPTPEQMLKADPGYQTRLKEGALTLEKGAAARGGLLSGGSGRALTRYAQDYASNEYQNVYNRISNIAGLGQVAVGNSSNAALNYGNQAAGAVDNAGYTRASSYVAKGNSWANALNQIGQLGGRVDWGALGRRPSNSGFDPAGYNSPTYNDVFGG